MIHLYQIYFNEYSYNNCLKKDVTLYYNEHLHESYENAAIVDIIDNYCKGISSKDYIGIFSHAFLTKAGKGQAHDFSKLGCEIELEKADCLSFFKSKKKQKIFHNEAAVYYNSLFDEMCNLLNLPYHSKITPRFIIMQNAFILRHDLYKDYVSNYLKPAIKLLCNSGTELQSKAAKVAPHKSSGKQCTYVPFLLEKLISAYLHLNKHIKCKHYEL